MNYFDYYLYMFDGINEFIEKGGCIIKMIRKLKSH